MITVRMHLRPVELHVHSKEILKHCLPANCMQIQKRMKLNKWKFWITNCGYYKTSRSDTNICFKIIRFGVQFTDDALAFHHHVFHVCYFCQHIFPFLFRIACRRSNDDQLLYEFIEFSNRFHISRYEKKTDTHRAYTFSQSSLQVVNYL